MLFNPLTPRNVSNEHYPDKNRFMNGNGHLRTSKTAMHQQSYENKFNYIKLIHKFTTFTPVCHNTDIAIPIRK